MITLISCPKTHLTEVDSSNCFFQENTKKQFLSQVAADPYLRNLYRERRMTRNVRRGVTAEKTINLKMRNRLAKWIGQINNQTFHFSSKTFINTLQILDEYLARSDQHFSQLQLIGCACLYISSKINESTIIAGQCYVECSGSIFTKEQLTQKEQLVFQTLDLNVNFGSPIRMISKMGKIAKINCQKLDEATNFLTESFFHESYKGFSQHDITLAIIVSVLQSNSLSHQLVLSKLTQGIEV